MREGRLLCASVHRLQLRGRHDSVCDRSPSWCERGHPGLIAPMETADADPAFRARAARGRPRWLVQCAALAAQPQYWHDGQLQVHVLALDTEISLRGVQLNAAKIASEPFNHTAATVS